MVLTVASRGVRTRTRQRGGDDGGCADRSSISPKENDRYTCAATPAEPISANRDRRAPSWHGKVCRGRARTAAKCALLAETLAGALHVPQRVSPSRSGRLIRLALSAAPSRTERNQRRRASHDARRRQRCVFATLCTAGATHNRRRNARLARPPRAAARHVHIGRSGDHGMRWREVDVQRLAGCGLPAVPGGANLDVSGPPPDNKYRGINCNNPQPFNRALVGFNRRREGLTLRWRGRPALNLRAQPR
jgi:hypothetical protein